MNMLTHLAFGLLAALVFLPEVSGAYVVIFVLVALLGALLPDVDHPNSFINERLGFTKVFSWLFSHRGLLHGLFGVLLFGGIAVYFNNFVAKALVVGYVSHLFGDALTNEGLHPIPFVDFGVHGPVRTGSFSEKIVFLFICAIILFVLYKAL